LPIIDQNNHKTYSTQGVVQHYAQLKQLQPAEATILKWLKPRLSQMKMLDIGVGGGRTTKHFAPLVGEYIGIDYSPKMIAACQKRFSTYSQPIRLEVCDARDLSRFPENYFDFILFSFNGIDYISHRDRLQVFEQIRRVGKPGGYFYFSSHNLQTMAPEFNWQKHLSFNPLKTYVNLAMWGILRLCNPGMTWNQLKSSGYAILRDESHNFRLQTYYIRPQEQVQQLTPNFRDIKIYSWKTGLELTGENDLYSNDDMWLYYFCVIQ
jgi:ubiquinone/menaquinone biosynthesis C-methylase UbiE